MTRNIPFFKMLRFEEIRGNHVGASLDLLAGEISINEMYDKIIAGREDESTFAEQCVNCGVYGG